MKNLTKILTLILCIAMMLTVFTACSVNGDSEKPATEKSDNTETKTDDKQTETDTTFTSEDKATPAEDETKADNEEASEDKATPAEDETKADNEETSEDKATPAEDETKADNEETTKNESEPAKPITYSNTVVISVKNYGDITLNLYADYAPETVANFIKLANEGFYDNTIFHRISKGFMIQGGGFTAEKPDVQKETATIPGEFYSNGFSKNKISHKRGIISMARTSVPDSASSQFFICDADSTFLDGQYAAFGVVTDGMDVVDAIASCEVTANPNENGAETLPVNYPVIETVKVIK